MTKATGAALLTAALELAGERCEDLNPLFWPRFFARRPDAAKLFTVVDPEQPPLGCNQMLWEITCVMLDHAGGQPYAQDYVNKTAVTHRDYDVFDHSLYHDVLAVFGETLGVVLGADWTAEMQAAWARQSESILATLPHH